jgi:hypothetical protein
MGLWRGIRQPRRGIGCGACFDLNRQTGTLHSPLVVAGAKGLAVAQII